MIGNVEARESSGHIPTVHDVRVFRAMGPWTTKSEGRLSVPLAISPRLLQEFFNYDSDELAKGPDIRGFRIYTVQGLAAGKIGGGEFHRLRQEMVFGLNGLLHWQMEDLHGQQRAVFIDSSTGVWMPPYILHTYEVVEKDSGVLVVANTLFDPEDKQTHDTYQRDTFSQIQL